MGETPKQTKRCAESLPLYDPHFPAPSYDLPPPIVFPRAPHAKALPRHDALLDEHRVDIAEKIRELAEEESPITPIHDLAVVVADFEPGVAPHWVAARHRADMARFLADYRGIVHRLHQRPDGPWFYAVAVAEETISLHALPNRLLVLEHLPARYRIPAPPPRHLVVEPRWQRHIRSGPWVATMFHDPGREPRLTWTRVPRRAASTEERTLRALARYEEQLRGKAWLFLKLTRKPPLGVLLSSRLEDVLGMNPRTPSDWARIAPRIAAAMAEPAPPLRFPVVVMTDPGLLALAWLDLDPTAADPAPPPGILVERTIDLDTGEPSRVDPPEPEIEEHPLEGLTTPRARWREQQWQVLQHLGPLYQVLYRMADMSDALLDREMTSFGFDPRVERSTLGLRWTVVSTIHARRPAGPPGPKRKPWRERGVWRFLFGG